MALHARFFLPGPLTPGSTVPLPDAAAHHALRVLRLRDGAALTLFDGRGGEHDAVLHVTGRQAAATLVAFHAVERESPLAVTLVQAWIAADKLDWVIEKATELGAARILLAPAGRSVVRLSGTRLAQRIGRLQQIAVAACCQCGRNRVPEVAAADSLAAALSQARTAAAAAWILEPSTEQARPALAAASLALAVGPEGGWTDEERAAARAAGWCPVALGPRILRTESAGLAALAAVQALAGDLR